MRLSSTLFILFFAFYLFIFTFYFIFSLRHETRFIYDGGEWIERESWKSE